MATAVRKPRCASAVSSLARSWQSWASEHAGRQGAAPAGWVPSSLTQDGSHRPAAGGLRPPVSAGVQAEPRGSVCAGEGAPRAGAAAVAKSGCGSQRVRALAEQGGPGDGERSLGEWSPAWGRGDRKLGSRSSSLDTQDSGLGEEGLSDTDADGRTGDRPPSQTGQTRNKDRPKIQVVTLGDLRSRWQVWSEQHLEQQKLNPFSEGFDYVHAMALRLQKGDEGYGRPKEGSRTAERAQRAQRHIRREMEEMCFIIRDLGARGPDGGARVTFGRLFDRYVKISDKVVGILLRCRKHGMVAFEGEMLWKGRDDSVIITLLG
ncbi:actin-binding Rho-activating protein [Lepisosteus oculatus]|uniref:actin-binding Rho-activating protein n=1 Tax=Lepisosteus oculatus TaxID=7918 RepID=UPI0035F511FE